MPTTSAWVEGDVLETTFRRVVVGRMKQRPEFLNEYKRDPQGFDRRLRTHCQKGQLNVSNEYDALAYAYTYFPMRISALGSMLIAAQSSLQQTVYASNKPTTLVDIGCGPMSLGLVLAREYRRHCSSESPDACRLRYIGYDLSEIQLRLAAALHKDSGLLTDTNVRLVNNLASVSVEEIAERHGDGGLVLVGFSHFFSQRSVRPKDLVECAAFCRRLTESLGVAACKIVYANPFPAREVDNYLMFLEELGTGIHMDRHVTVKYTPVYCRDFGNRYERRPLGELHCHSVTVSRTDLWPS